MFINLHGFFSFLIIATTINLGGCSLPINSIQPEQATQSYSEHWLNHQNTDADKKLNDDLTAYLTMSDAFQSIAARVHLIRKAQHTLDLQYYIWVDDFIGHLMLQELLKAADRGVKVRLLIDDQNGTQLDDTLVALAQHPNISIRLYNPYKYRNLRVIDYIFRFNNINHRMHNKLIVADGAIAVTGGRNISSEYFDASESFQFTDMDVLFYGTAVEQANKVFLNFWNYDLSYPVQNIIAQGSAEDLAQLRLGYSKTSSKNRMENNVDQKVNQEQKNLEIQLTQQQPAWAKAYFLADHPNKTKAQAKDHQLIHNQILQKMGQPKTEFELVSAYFVPTEQGTTYLSKLAKSQVKVRILTNSLVANDVALVHAFYQKYRKPLLASGAKLYEFKPYIERERRTWYEVMTGNVIPAKGKNTSSLHAKFFDVDDKVFIGSFNFDPRSIHLNTEVGLMVHSDQLQAEVSTLLDHYLPTVAYELKLDAQGNVIWLEQKDGAVIEHKTEPESTKFQRFMIKAVSYLPIEWMI